MTGVSIRRFIVAGVAIAAVVGPVGTAAAQSDQGARSTPKNWNYEIKDGKRVPKGQRVTNADGSWQEQIRQGACVTLKERSPSGEVKVTRKCN